jgi:hypothetical protein
MKDVSKTKHLFSPDPDAAPEGPRVHRKYALVYRFRRLLSTENSADFPIPRPPLLGGNAEAGSLRRGGGCIIISKKDRGEAASGMKRREPAGGGASVEAMLMMLAAAEAELEALRLEEPEDEESDAHEEWENDMDDLMDEIDELKEEITPA